MRGTPAARGGDAGTDATRRLLLWTLAVVAVGALLFITFRPSAVPVDLAEVQRGALQVTLDHEGKTRVHDRYVVSAPVAGRVRRIEAEPGDPLVANKTVLAEFLPTAPALLDARADVASAEHDLDAARAVLVGANAGPSGAAPVLVRAPIDGVVLQRLHESEAVVPSGAPLIELADPADLEIVSDYLSTDAVQMRPGLAVMIDRWGGGAPLHGRVRLVEPHGFLKVSALGVEEQRVNVVTAFDDPRSAWHALGDGYRVETHVVLWETADTLKVPSSALFRQGSGWAVFVVQDGRARLRSVDIGRQSGFEAQVLGGLTEDEQVIVHPSDAVTDGVRVAARR